MAQQNSRRTFIKTIGSVSFTGIAGSAINTADSDDTNSKIDASRLLIPDEDIPDEFEKHPNPDTSRLLNVLCSADSRFNMVESAVQGFCKGGTKSNTQSVISTMALVGDDTLPQLHIEAAIELFCREYISEYKDETTIPIRAALIRHATDNEPIWQIDISATHPDSGSASSGFQTFTEKIQQQYFENVSLITIVSQPLGSTTLDEPLLGKYATIQRSRYESVSNEVSD